MSITTLSWLFTLGVLFHNTEEALFLPAWSKAAGRWHAKVGARAFRLAAIVLSAVLVLLAFSAQMSGPRSVAAYLLTGYVFTMVVNVWFPHVGASLIMRRYMPGTATALLFNLPLGVLFLCKSLGTGYVLLSTLIWVAPIVALTMLLSLPALFAIGRTFRSGQR